MVISPTDKAFDLVIFGAKSDLMRRKLLPSLYNLEKINLLHPETRIIGVGRADWDINTYLNIMYNSLKTFLKEPIDNNLWKKLSARLDFCNLDINNIKDFVLLEKKVNQYSRITINYFAVPSRIFGIICKGLGETGLNGEKSRIIMEKPLGTDLFSSQMINNQVSKYFNENQIYRIDHYLGKETVLNLLVLRFANSIFTSNWNNQTIDHIQITVSEKIGIEGRWEYFDKIGQMRDMIQSHLLQVLTIITMSPPLDLNTNHICNEKIKILRSLRPIDFNNVRDITVRGQYKSGFVQGKKVPGYLEEKGANKNSNTETFVSIRVDIDNFQWEGVPFYLRTGKRLPFKYSEIVVYFKKPIFNLFKDSYQELPKNKLTIRLQPDEGIDIQILSRVSGLNYKHLFPITKLDLNFVKFFDQNHLIDAYERLLLESINGIQSLFVRRDEIEESWKWVDSVMRSWDINNDTLKFYKAGTWGPEASMKMISRDGYSWNKYVKYKF